MIYTAIVKNKNDYCLTACLYKYTVFIILIMIFTWFLVKVLFSEWLAFVQGSEYLIVFHLISLIPNRHHFPFTFLLSSVFNLPVSVYNAAVGCQPGLFCFSCHPLFSEAGLKHFVSLFAICNVNKSLLLITFVFLTFPE